MIKAILRVNCAPASEEIDVSVMGKNKWEIVSMFGSNGDAARNTQEIQIVG